MSARALEHRYLRAISLAMVLALVVPGLLAAKSKTVKFPAADGHSLTGTLWGNGDAPGILLLHQCNSSRAMYEELGGKLAAAGFKVLSIDFRGFGDSKGNGLDVATAGSEDRQRAMAGFPYDAEAAYTYLAQQGKGVVAGALGASCGGGQVVGLGKAHSELARMGFFSSGLRSEHVRDLLRMSDRDLLLIAAKGDTGAAGPAGTIAYRGGKSRTQLFLYDGDAHGYPLFAQDPELADKMVDFYRPLLDSSLQK